MSLCLNVKCEFRNERTSGGDFIPYQCISEFKNIEMCVFQKEQDGRREKYGGNFLVYFLFFLIHEESSCLNCRWCLDTKYREATRDEITKPFSGIFCWPIISYIN